MMRTMVRSSSSHFHKELNMPKVNGKKYPYTAAGKKAAAAARKKKTKKKVNKKRRMGY